MPKKLIISILFSLYFSLISISSFAAAQVEQPHQVAIDDRVNSISEQIKHVDTSVEEVRKLNEDKIEQRIQRLENWVFQSAASALVLLITIVVGGSFTINRLVKEKINEIVTGKSVEENFQKVIDSKLDSKLNEVMELNFLTSQGLACFNNGDYAAAYDAFKKLYQNFHAINSTFILAHYAFLAQKNNDRKVARKIYLEILNDSANYGDDYYIKSAINYSDFLYDDSPDMSLDVLVKALKNSSKSDGKIDLNLNIASYYLLNGNVENARNFMAKVEDDNNLATRPKVNLEYLFYKYSYKNISSKLNNSTLKEEIYSIIANGGRSEYWNPIRHLENLKSITSSVEYKDIKKLANEICLGRILS